MSAIDGVEARPLCPYHVNQRRTTRLCTELTEDLPEKSSNGTSIVSDLAGGGTIGVFSRTFSVVRNEDANGIMIEYS